jgi:ribonucleoside-triphosphate reductase
MSVFSFELSKDFVDQYRGRVPEFGYRTPAGLSLGELTFLDKYSRLKGDGTKESWLDVCVRVINGMYSIQKDHCKQNRIPFNGKKAQTSAREAFDLLFTMKWSPPGRGLWMMGTPLVMTQNCFVGDTSILTREGVRELVDLVDQEVEVWTRSGWTPATVRSFGRQPVQRISFAPYNVRSNHRVVEVATPNHRWELADGTTTTSLSVGDVVPCTPVTSLEFDEEAYRHGLIFADGSVGYRYKNGDFSHSMRLCGAKEKYKSYFSKYHYQPNCDGDPVAYHRSSTNMKELPQGRSPEYNAAFIRGWVALDGSRSACGGFILSTQNQEAADWLILHAAEAGFSVTGINTQSGDTQYGPRSAPLRKISLVETPSFMRVRSIEVLDEEEEVYCAVVPGVERFTLASGIYTSNCAFISTKDMRHDDPAYPFCFLMEASMLGIGCGFDAQGAGRFLVHEPQPSSEVYVVPDTREGWVQSVRLLLNSYLISHQPEVSFDYTLIRPAGEPIKTFGGTAAGPAPLQRLHAQLRKILSERSGTLLDLVTIADIGNLIGVCVVSGNVRRSAEIFIGPMTDEFVHLKDPSRFPERNFWSSDPDDPRRGWGYMSNNSPAVVSGSDLSGLVPQIIERGEPGVIWIDVARKYGRLSDPPDNRDWRVEGFNPCGEQPLESGECCTLVDVFLNRHSSKEELERTLKVAFLYAKTVTLLSTHWRETNAIMQRNRRIGLSLSGVADFLDEAPGRALQLREWTRHGYDAIRRYDRLYSEWLCVRESIRVTTEKPGGTTGLVFGVTPGVHWLPGSTYTLRTIRLSVLNPQVEVLRAHGYKVEPDVTSPDTTVVVYFPLALRPWQRTEQQVSVWEKAALAAQMQHDWSDNSVSVSLSFDRKTEGPQISRILAFYDGKLKSVSFQPYDADAVIYPQAPFIPVTKEVYDEHVARLRPIEDMGIFYQGGAEASGEKYCTTDKCEIPQRG